MNWIRSVSVRLWLDKIGWGWIRWNDRVASIREWGIQLLQIFLKCIHWRHWRCCDRYADRRFGWNDSSHIICTTNVCSRWRWRRVKGWTVMIQGICVGWGIINRKLRFTWKHRDSISSLCESTRRKGYLDQSSNEGLNPSDEIDSMNMSASMRAASGGVEYGEGMDFSIFLKWLLNRRAESWWRGWKGR